MCTISGQSFTRATSRISKQNIWKQKISSSRLRQKNLAHTPWFPIFLGHWELLTLHGKPKQNTYFLIARSLNEEGVQFRVSISGNKVSIYSITNFAKLADGESCAIWHNQSHSDCCYNDTEDADNGKASKLLLMSQLSSLGRNVHMYILYKTW